MKITGIVPNHKKRKKRKKSQTIATCFGREWAINLDFMIYNLEESSQLVYVLHEKSRFLKNKP